MTTTLFHNVNTGRRVLIDTTTDVSLISEILGNTTPSGVDGLIRGYYAVSRGWIIVSDDTHHDLYMGMLANIRQRDDLTTGARNELDQIVRSRSVVSERALQAGVARYIITLSNSSRTIPSRAVWCRLSAPERHAYIVNDYASIFNIERLDPTQILVSYYNILTSGSN